MKEIERKVKEVLGYPEEMGLCVIKRHINDEYSYHEILNEEVNREKTVEELMILENEVLFVEKESGMLRWPQEFEAERYKITIRYLIPTPNPLFHPSSLLPTSLPSDHK